MFIVAPAGSSKLELVQTASALSNCPLFEVNASPFGEPLEFAYSLKQIMLSINKLDEPSFVVVNDQATRDTLYFEFLFVLMSNLVKDVSAVDQFILFDKQFKLDLIEVEL